MKKIILLSLVIIEIFFLTSCYKADMVIKQDTSMNLDTLYAQTAKTLFKARPENATMLGLDEKVAGGKYNNRLPDYSPAAEAKLRADLHHLLQAYKASKQTDTNKDVMQNITRYYAGNKNFSVGYIDTWMGLSPFIVNQINGPLIDVPNAMITNQQIHNLGDAKDYISRLDHFDLFVENVLAKMNLDSQNGWVPPLIIINKSIATMQDFIKPQANNHAFVTSFKDKLAEIDGINAESKADLIETVQKLVKNKVYPAYANVIRELNDLNMSAGAKSGIWAQPNGNEFYKDAVKMLGDTDLTAAEIHQLGLDEVARISQQMDKILIAQGMKNGTVGQRMATLNDEQKFLYQDSVAGREQLIADLNHNIQQIDAQMDRFFATRPKYKVEVRKFPKSREASAPGGMYTNPPLDGSQPGIYWINLRDIKANPKFDLKTLTYHEAIPGHHWQIALNLAQTDMPMLRRIAPYNAYVEGWALYAERVAAEMGMYKGDAFGDLGRLKAELYRAVRLVVDTGLHYKKWSREKAIKYMAETTGTVESDVVVEIERYMVWPGQALGYKLGMLNILRLREKAKEQLGVKFNIKAFHDLILLGGAVPMSILNKKVDAWIMKQK